MITTIAIVGLRLRLEPEFTTSPKGSTVAELSSPVIEALEFYGSAEVAARLNDLHS